MKLDRFKRRKYTPFATPLEPLANISQYINNCPKIWIKRDDMLGLASGGNKTRKLEFLMADAIKQQADCIITCGAIQSNHCRLTLAACNKEQLPCYLVLEERVEGTYHQQASGNHLLFQLLGATNIDVYPNQTNLTEKMELLANRLREEGKNPYIIPGGGSNEIGALGYVACATEISQHCFELGISFDYVVVASGSAGTQSGLITGLFPHTPVIGINVMKSKNDQEARVYDLVSSLCRRLEIPYVPQTAIVCDDHYVGPGYAQSTPEMIQAVQLLAQEEGILLDPVYSGKAFAGLIGLIKSQVFKPQQRVLFVHTGGSPALYEYKDHFANTQLAPERIHHDIAQR